MALGRTRTRREPTEVKRTECEVTVGIRTKCEVIKACSKGVEAEGKLIRYNLVTANL